MITIRTSQRPTCATLFLEPVDVLASQPVLQGWELTLTRRTSATRKSLDLGRGRRRRRVGQEVDEQVGAARGDEEVTLAHHNGDDRRRASCVAHKELPVVQAPCEERAW